MTIFKDRNLRWTPIPRDEEHPSDVERGAGSYIRKSARSLRRRIIWTTLASFLITYFLFSSVGRTSRNHVPALFKPTKYEVVSGFFAQSLNTTDDSTFDFVSARALLLMTNRLNPILGSLTRREISTIQVIDGFDLQPKYPS
jgi:hypothetical protein